MESHDLDRAAAVTAQQVDPTGTATNPFANFTQRVHSSNPRVHEVRSTSVYTNTNPSSPRKPNLRSQTPRRNLQVHTPAAPRVINPDESSRDRPPTDIRLRQRTQFNTSRDPVAPTIPDIPSFPEVDNSGNPAAQCRQLIEGQQDVHRPQINFNQVSSIMKAYQERSKFTGSFDEDFQGFLEKFETFCSIYNLNDDEKARSFPFMLDTGALFHFTNNFSGKSFTYQEVVNKFNGWYKSEEQRNQLLMIRQKPSLMKAMQSNPDHSEVDLFRQLVAKLTSFQRQLHPSYREDRFLRDQLIIGADLPHIQHSLQDKIPTTAQEAVNRILSKLSNEAKSAGINLALDEDIYVQYSLGKSFGEDARQRRNYNYRHRNDRRTNTQRRELASFRGCWVCGAHHRARDNHSKEDLLKAINRIRKSKRTSAFNLELLIDFEWALLGDEQDEISQIDQPTDATNDTDTESGDSAYMMDENTISRNVATYFSDISYLQGTSFCDENLTSHLKSLKYLMHVNEPTIFKGFIVDNSGYSADACSKVKGMIIDTGANRSSIISLSQYKAYCR